MHRCLKITSGRQVTEMQKDNQHPCTGKKDIWHVADLSEFPAVGECRGILNPLEEDVRHGPGRLMSTHVQVRQACLAFGLFERRSHSPGREMEEPELVALNVWVTRNRELQRVERDR